MIEKDRATIRNDGAVWETLRVGVAAAAIALSVAPHDVVAAEGGRGNSIEPPTGLRIDHSNAGSVRSADYRQSPSTMVQDAEILSRQLSIVELASAPFITNAGFDKNAAITSARALGASTKVFRDNLFSSFPELRSSPKAEHTGINVGVTLEGRKVTPKSNLTEADREKAQLRSHRYDSWSYSNPDASDLEKLKKWTMLAATRSATLPVAIANMGAGRIDRVVQSGDISKGLNNEVTVEAVTNRVAGLRVMIGQIGDLSKSHGAATARER